MFRRDVSVTKPFLGKQRYLSYLRNKYEDTIFSDIPDILEDETDVEWADALNEDKRHVKEAEYILGNYIQFEELVDVEQLFAVLDESPETDLYSILRTEERHLREIGERIESEFDSDSEFIKYISENHIDHPLFHFDPNPEEVLRNLKDRYSGDGIHERLHIDLSQNLLFSKLYIERSIFVKDQFESLIWNTEPEVGQFIVKTETPTITHIKRDSCPAESLDEEYTLVVKIVDKNTIEKKLLDAYPISVTSVTVEAITYDEKLLDLYSNHHIITNEQSTLDPAYEYEMEFYDENPLPLD